MFIFPTGPWLTQYLKLFWIYFYENIIMDDSTFYGNVLSILLQQGTRNN